MPQQTKIFRVFVSSTFADMKEERRILQKEVFPKLEKFCESKGARFQAVDLRWGVNEESQLNQKTLQICLNEVARCQKISPRPNFIILLGNRYGWQPVPEKIPEEEMKQIQGALGDDGKKVIDQWYKLDENAVPTEYVLQPRGDKYRKYEDWQKEETNIRDVLRQAVSKLKFDENQLIKYETSATHQEIINGALNPPDDAKNPEEHVFAFVREIEGLPQDGSAEDFIDLDADGKPDDYSKKQLIKLKVELKARLGDHYITYPADWKNGKSAISDAKKFSEQALKFLKDIIEGQLDKVTSDDEIAHEVKLHEEFKKRLTEHFRGRVEILNTIQNYLDNGSEKKVLSLIGKSGSGKSSVMAQAVKLNEGSADHMAYRFIGTSSRSSNIVSLLQSVCGEVAKEFDQTLESLAGEGREKSLYDINGMTEVFRTCLALGTAEKPVVIFLDALDQLSESDYAQALHWLPKELPEHARLVVSALPQLEGNLSGTDIEQLPLLPKAEAVKILNRWFEVANRKLTDKQHQLVMNKFTNQDKDGEKGLPIFLKLAFEKSRHWHSYEDDVTLKDDVQGMIKDYFDFLNEEHTEPFVRNAISYMLCGKYQGLTENEILEILAFDKDYRKILLEQTHEDHRKEQEAYFTEMDDQEKYAKIPVILWSRLFLDLEPFLTERDADGVPIITFFHRQFNEVLRNRYQLFEEPARA